ncbi:predicted hydrolase/acyltransferase [Paenibacillus popilliae ATCC 14706]|uniref:Predicted hydrolase/acyltransferase n=1 Tax=Paenibacillus popilliae ATCC 14706 TaxID=1212764 RepID=M9M0D5_PAEPP|nr:predicted hydrolase/acyltransferase [Paenibacillus popilliae ATCC 14706]
MLNIFYGKCHIRKLDKQYYVDLETGEKREFQLSENRSEIHNSLRQTFKNCGISSIITL